MHRDEYEFEVLGNEAICALASGAADCLATRSHCYPVQLHRALFPTGPSTSDGPLIPETCSTNSEDIAESHSCVLVVA